MYLPIIPLTSVATMKTFTSTFLCAAATALIAVGCDRHHDNPADPITSTVAASGQPSGQAPATPPVLVGPQNPQSDLIAGVMAELKDSTYETRSTISAAFDPVDRQIQERVSIWKANGSQFTEPAERQLEDARANAVQKFKELGEATEQTWNTAKDNATSALMHLQGAINDLRESDKLKRTQT
jgi:hypothetical protein